MTGKPDSKGEFTDQSAGRPVSSEPQIDISEVSLKLDSLAANIERLTEIALENRRLINSLYAIVASNAQPAADMRNPGFANNPKKEPRSGAETYRDPFSYASGSIPASPSSESDEEPDDEQLQEERLKKYEKDNPW